MKSILGVAVAALSAATLIAGCASSKTDTPASSTDDITVFAAASLKSTFTELGEQFQKDNAGTKVTFSFAGSSDLVTQLTQGAPADVFASADEKNMTKATDAGIVSGQPVDFATNTLTIVTPPGNPKGIKTFADLAKPGTQVVVCAPQVPCGSATEKVEKATGVALAPVSEESAVTDVLGKITSGQADAGLVYVTDAAGAGDKVTSVPFPESSGAVNTYPIALLKDSKNTAAAQKFIDLVTGPEGQKVLGAAGFAAP
ncbi:molybdate-binding protein [Mycobacterium sp. Root135]|uniref:molybdate ABC transporter substrate-binding protein n=1 Tax=Mycobacterium sp. Root135 TaxID=1736457 RepID=UPI0006FAAD0A|nr:molybdate ABC transporter substrate-binding protein [Mycobacterium sp. Root135]KQY08209.1 molybdate-binding protein [Mycobacterium sp. Root135]